MKLQKNTRLALYSVLEFASDPTRHIAAGEIAQRYGVSSHHLAKVLSELARAGVVESARGVGGGYRFAANARRLTLMDVIQLFEKLESELDMPNHGNPAGEPIVAELRSITAEIDDLTKAILDTITLDTALKSTRLRKEALAAGK